MLTRISLESFEGKGLESMVHIGCAFCHIKIVTQAKILLEILTAGGRHVALNLYSSFLLASVFILPIYQLIYIA